MFLFLLNLLTLLILIVLILILMILKHLVMVVVDYVGNVIVPLKTPLAMVVKKGHIKKVFFQAKLGHLLRNLNLTIM